MTLEKVIEEVTLVANCEPSLQSHGRWLLDRLSETRSWVVEGQPLQVGWSLFTPVRVGARIWVHEPDFECDPERNTRNEISVSVGILAQQIEVVRRAGVTPRDVYFADVMEVQQGALEATDAVLERFETANRGHSGWIAKPRGDDSGELRRIPVFELLRRRREWLQVLCLPPGYMAVFRRSDIEAILDRDDNDVWHQGIET